MLCGIVHVCSQELETANQNHKDTQEKYEALKAKYGKQLKVLAEEIATVREIQT